jgi:hypothetical protein
MEFGIDVFGPGTANADEHSTPAPVPRGGRYFPKL